MRRLALVIGLLGLAAAAGYLGYLSWSLAAEKRALEDGLAQAERRAAQIKQRFEEEKARGAAAARAKAAAETARAEALGALKSAEAENAALKKSLAEVQILVETLKKSQASGFGELEKKIAAIEAQKSDLAGRLKSAEDALKAKAAAAEQLNKEIQRLNADIERGNRDLAKMREHNKRLVAIGEELIERYKNKGIGKGLLQNEPFTQLGKIEFEQMRQEYLDRIDKERVGK